MGTSLFYTHLYCLVECLSIIVWTHVVLGVLYYACVLYFCICTCSAQLSMFHMERCSRNTLIVTIIIMYTWSKTRLTTVVCVSEVWQDKQQLCVYLEHSRTNNMYLEYGRTNSCTCTWSMTGLTTVVCVPGVDKQQWYVYLGHDETNNRGLCTWGMMGLTTVVCVPGVWQDYQQRYVYLEYVRTNSGMCTWSMAGVTVVHVPGVCMTGLTVVHEPGTVIHVPGVWQDSQWYVYLEHGRTNSGTCTWSMAGLKTVVHVPVVWQD